ncbi:hypothetical protein KVT40_006277 [Elsinoe batatas]|uniref:DUF2293 domain-containing protein n=1 Tax=Elsinoe batatas TaxID=2601811 RepID=A0A8K0PDM7_9PEZI|nr:hypothetical protein KVT40_006277 [Elsinoe batatas]
MARIRAASAENVVSAAARRHKGQDKNSLHDNIRNNTAKKTKSKTKHPKSNPEKPPPGYSFLVVGYPDVAERCRVISLERGVDFRQISANPRDGGQRGRNSNIAKHLHRLGYHIRTDIFDEAVEELGYRIDGRKLVKIDVAEGMEEYERIAKRFGVDVKEENAQRAAREDARKVQATIKELFPFIPEDEAEVIFSRAWQKGSQNVGRATTIDLGKKVQLAVAAHIRHEHTAYDSLLNARVPWLQCRKMVEADCLRKIIEWRGDDPEALLGEAYQGVLEDTLIMTEDETPAERSEPDRYADNEDSTDDSIIVENNPAAAVAEFEQPPTAYESGTDFYKPRIVPRRSMDEGKRRSAFLAKYQQARSQTPQHQKQNNYAPSHRPHPQIQSPLYTSHAQQQYGQHTAPNPSYSPAYAPPQPVPAYHQPHYPQPTMALPPPPPSHDVARPEPPPSYASSSIPYHPPAPLPLPVQDLPPQLFFDENNRPTLLEPATHELLALSEESAKMSQRSRSTVPSYSAPVHVPSPPSYQPALTIAHNHNYDDDDDAYEPPSVARSQIYDSRGRAGLPEASPYAHNSTLEDDGFTVIKASKKLSRKGRARQKAFKKQARMQRKAEILYDDDDGEEDEYDPAQAVVRVDDRASLRPPPPNESHAQRPQYYVPPPPPPAPRQPIPSTHIYDRPTPLPHHGAPALIQPSQRVQYHPPPQPPVPMPQYAPAPPMYQHPVQHYQYAPHPPPLPPPPPPPQYYQQPVPGYDHAYYQR